MFSFSNRLISSSCNFILSVTSSLLLGTGVLIKVDEYERMEEDDSPVMKPINGGDNGNEVVAFTT